MSQLPSIHVNYQSPTSNGLSSANNMSANNSLLNDMQADLGLMSSMNQRLDEQIKDLKNERVGLEEELKGLRLQQSFILLLFIFIYYFS